MQNEAVQSKQPAIVDRLISIALLIAVVALGIVAFFSLMELLLTFAAQGIGRSAGSVTRSKYALVTVRNLWLLGGGAVLIGFVMYCIDYFFKHWPSARMRRLFLRLIVIEAGIIVLQFFIAS